MFISDRLRGKHDASSTPFLSPCAVLILPAQSFKMHLLALLPLFSAISEAAFARHSPHHHHLHKGKPRAELVQVDNDIVPRQAASTSTAPPDAQCTNGPTSRQCWGNGYSIATNYDAVWPNTGKVVKYTLEVTNTTMALDGFPRLVMAINGQYPGPTIRASWGDTLQITVKNSLQVNGTSMHWHGLRQWKTNPMDGTNGVTECPLAPGQSRTYTFLCTQFGTSWYHSHYSDQYAEIHSMRKDVPADTLQILRRCCRYPDH
jgi:Multicopper oxidase